MKKLLFLAVVVSTLFACSKKNDADVDLKDGNSVVGKSFQYTYEYESGGLPSADIYTISFPTRGTCQFSISGYYYDFDVKKYMDPFMETLDYIVSGNKIITEESSYYKNALVFTYSKNTLTNEYGDVYVYSGTVDIDEDLDMMFNPNGKRTYIPVGWYESGYAESTFEMLTNGYLQAGDIQGFLKYANSDLELGTTAIHVVDENTIEFAAATCSTQKPSTGYYATKNYRDWENNYTVYFYYTYATETLKYKMVDDVVYVKTDQGWLKYSIVVSNNSIATQLFTYKKINYSGGYAW